MKMGMMVVAGGLALVPVFGQPTAPVRPAPTRVDLAPGVYLFKTAPYGEVGLDGNTVVITSSDGVLVFDSNGTPTAARAVIAAIKAMTDQPVRYVVNSHWHWDHWYGTESYVDAFPGVQVIAHERTRQLMAGPAVEFNRPGLESQLPGYLAMLEERLKATPPPQNPTALRERIATGRWFLAEKRAVRHVLPTVTYSDRLTLRLGSREIQLMHVDRAVTPGDTMIYLPQEQMLLTADVLVNPISFALSSYPAGWIRTLEWIDALNPALLVPGHGEPMNDESRLHATLSILRLLRTLGAAARARGLDAFAAADEAFPLVREPMLTLTGDNAQLNQAFRSQLVEWFMHRVYDELAGPLTDAIAPIPSRSRQAGT
jgi:glyoxylase-like metal-dependent hydrolase (beta-lactamase superfamily II)